MCLKSFSACALPAFALIVSSVLPGGALADDEVSAPPLLLPLCVQERCGYVGPDGDWVIGPAFSRVQPFAQGVALVRDGDYGVIDQQGAWMIEPNLRGARLWAGDGFVVVNTDYPTDDFIIDTARDTVIETDFDGDIVLARPENGLAIHRYNGVFGLSVDGEMVYRFGNVIAAGQTPEGGLVLIVRDDDGATLVVDETLQPLDFPPITSITRFSQDGIAVAGLDGRFGFIEADGSWRVAPRFRGATQPSEGRSFVAVDEDGYTLMDLSGTPIADAPYHRFSPFHDGYAVALRTDAPDQEDETLVTDRGDFFVLDRNGVERLSSHRRITNLGNGLFLVYREGGVDIWSAERGWVSQGEFARAQQAAEGVLRVWDANEVESYLDLRNGTRVAMDLSPVMFFRPDAEQVVDLTAIHQAAAADGKGVIVMLAFSRGDLQLYSGQFREEVAARDRFGDDLRSRYVGVTLYMDGARTVSLNGERFPENMFAEVFSFEPTFLLMPAQGPGRGDLCLRRDGFIGGYPGADHFIQLLEWIEHNCATPE